MGPINRSVEVCRESVDPKAGTFEAVLFTDGEASDGHILRIAGGDIPERMPLFVNHFPDPREQLGSLHFLERNDHEVRVRGEIMVEGEGAAAEIRRDLVAKMAQGHVSRMSGRWDFDDGDAVKRTALPKDHPAHVTEKAAGSKRYGLHFDRWRAMEGSIVGLGADPAATVRFAEEAQSEPVREFWRSQTEPEPEAEVPVVDDEARKAALRAQLRELAEQGIDPDLVREVLAETEEDERSDLGDKILEAVESLGERMTALEAKIRSASQTAVEVQAPEGIATHEPAVQRQSPEEIGQELAAMVKASEANLLARLTEKLQKATGKVAR